MNTSSTYLLDPRNDLLIDALTQQHCVIDHVQWFDQIGSTNDQAKLETGHQTALIISNRQTAGRGQSGRQWQSPTGNLYLSLLTHLQHPISGRLALEVALALNNMPILAHHADLQIKWPNDLYYHDAKWGGILIEPLHDNAVVIGVGLNLKAMQADVLDQSVTDLYHITGQHLDQLELAVQTTQALFEACQHFDHGSLALDIRFAAYDALLEQPVLVQQPGLPDMTGVALGIHPDGALVVESNQQQHVIYSAHVRKQ